MNVWVEYSIKAIDDQQHEYLNYCNRVIKEENRR